MNSDVSCTTGESSVDWGDISDAEMLGIQSEHLDPVEKPSSDDQSHAKEIVKIAKVWFKRRKSMQTTQLSVPGRTPMERFFKKRLSVTQVCEQTWCEVKMIYGLLKPFQRMIEMQTPVVTTGASIHLARELEDQGEIVSVPAATKEDWEAIKFLNMLQKISSLVAGTRVREFPVFGVPEGVFFTGIIDELCVNDSGELVLSELKTRNQNSFPHPAQFKGHALQVRLYKLLFDGMLNGQVQAEQYTQHLWLRSQQPLGAEIQALAKCSGYPSFTFGQLLDHLLMALASCKIRQIAKLSVEYRHQSSEGLIGTREVEFEEAQLRAELQGYLAYWKGEREPQGVDVEDAWKCRMCPHEESCEWRQSRSVMAVTENSNKRARWDSPTIS